MQITVNLTDPQATSIALDEVIFAQAVTEINLSTIPATEAIADGTSLALLTPQGKAMAITQVASNVATLNTNTIECYEFVRDLPVEAARDAYIVLGSATKPIAIVPVQVARNVMTITPPTEYAPIYPTALELQQTLARMQADVEDTATNAASVNNIAQTFPTTVENAKQEIENQTEAVTKDIMDAKKAAVEAAGDAEEAKNETQGLVDSINYSFSITTKDVGQGTETFIAPAEKDGITPRLDNNGKDIHNVSGFSGLPHGE